MFLDAVITQIKGGVLDQRCIAACRTDVDLWEGLKQAEQQRVSKNDSKPPHLTCPSLKSQSGHGTGRVRL